MRWYYFCWAVRLSATSAQWRFYRITFKIHVNLRDQESDFRGPLKGPRLKRSRNDGHCKEFGNVQIMTSCRKNPLKPQRTVAVRALHLVNTWPPTKTRLCCCVRKTLHWYLQAAVQQVKGLYATMFLVPLLEWEWIHILTAYTKLSNRQHSPLPGSPLIAVICTHSCHPFLPPVSFTVWSAAVHETHPCISIYQGTELSTWNWRLWVTNPI